MTALCSANQDESSLLTHDIVDLTDYKFTCVICYDFVPELHRRIVLPHVSSNVIVSESAECEL